MGRKDNEVISSRTEALVSNLSAIFRLDLVSRSFKDEERSTFSLGVNTEGSLCVNASSARGCAPATNSGVVRTRTASARPWTIAKKALSNSVALRTATG